MKFITEKMSRCIVFKGGGTNRTNAVAVNPKQDKLFDPSIDMMVNDFDDEQTLEEEEALAAVEAEDPHAELSSLQRIQDAVLTKWVNDPQRMDKRMLALIFLAHASDVLENAFAPLNDDDYELAMKRVRELLDLDFEQESVKANTSEVLWAVFAAFTK